MRTEPVWNLFLEDIIEHQQQLQIIDSSKNIALLEDEHGVNPHVWVSVSNYIIQVETIAEELSRLDPEHKNQYQQNAQDYIAKLKNLRQTMHEKIDKLPNKKIVTFHEAFPYFAKEFNLDIVGVIEREPGTIPSPHELTSIIDQVNSLNAKALFAEPQYSSSAAKTIANETKAKVYILDPTVTGENQPKCLYQNNATKYIYLEEALK